MKKLRLEAGLHFVPAVTRKTIGLFGKFSGERKWEGYDTDAT